VKLQGTLNTRIIYKSVLMLFTKNYQN